VKLIYKFLKIINKKKYYEKKFLLKIERERYIFDSKIKNELKKIDIAIKTKKELNFLHSGHCGDLLYSLPLIKKISETHKCNLLIGVNKKLSQEYYKHPAKNVFIDQRMFSLILPLLKNQNYLKDVKQYSNEIVDINLDIFRDLPISLSFNSSKWYFHIAGVTTDLSQPYLVSSEHNLIKNKIVLLRSLRNRNYLINYNFLNEYNEDFIFIGLKDEYEDLKKQVRNLTYYEPKDFWEMSQVIKSSKFFLGNQSLAFSIAEGLKVPRLLESKPDLPYVQPNGGKCFDFYFQIHFEKYFNILYRS